MTEHSVEINCKNIEDLVNKVFSIPPPEPHQYCLNLDGAQSPHDIFRSLGQILTHGLVYLYGPEVNLLTLTTSQIQTVQSYLRGFGYQALVNPKNPSDHPSALPWLLKLPTPQGQDVHYVNIAFEAFY